MILTIVMAPLSRLQSVVAIQQGSCQRQRGEMAAFTGNMFLFFRPHVGGREGGGGGRVGTQSVQNLNAVCVSSCLLLSLSASLSLALLPTICVFFVIFVVFS